MVMRSGPTRWRSAALLGTAALFTLWAIHAATATPSSTWTASAHSVSAVKVVTNNDGQTYSSPSSWTDVDGATVTLSVSGSWTSALFSVRFAALACGGLTSVHALVDGAEANPGPTTFGFGDSCTRIADSLDGFATVGAGSHTIQVQVMGGTITFVNWSLSVERARVS
jgi:hypothetical protein